MTTIGEEGARLLEEAGLVVLKAPFGGMCRSCHTSYDDGSFVAKNVRWPTQSGSSEHVECALSRLGWTPPD